MKERPSAALQTALSTLIAGGGQIAVMKGIEVMAQRGQAHAQGAEANAKALALLNQFAASSKVLARSPETFESFVAAASAEGPVSHVFIDGKLLMQSGLGETLASVSPAVAAQIDLFPNLNKVD